MGSLAPGELVELLTLQQKATLVSGADLWHSAALPEREVAAITLTDGPHGVRLARQGGQLGLGDSVPATCFPTASATASTWDLELLREVGEAIGREACALGVGVVLGPGVNIKRSPLCGRNFEYFSEDPHLAGELAASWIEGVQSVGVGASLKHFAANNQETDRLRVSVEIDERVLREIYLPAFEAAVTRARPWTVMCSYNRINGVHSAENPWLLTSVLRDDWGFDGLVVSDWSAVHALPEALAAGLDLEMPSSGGVGPADVVAAVRAGSLAVDVLDQAVVRVLELVAKVGSPPPALAALPEADVVAHHALARRVAARSAVLLRNEGELLPLDPTDRTPLAVIGAFAMEPRYQGSGSSQVNPTRLDIGLEQLRLACPGRPVEYAPGFALDEEPPDASLVAQAVALARRAGQVVIFAGLPASSESEGFDRRSIALPPAQVEVIQQVAAVNPATVVVLASGGVVSLEPWHDAVAAIVMGWLGGQAGAGGIVDVLTGAVNPSGRLAETIPLREADGPAYLTFPGELGRVDYGEGVFVGYRGFDAVGREVRYPFGHGLGYTSFEYSQLELDVVGDDLVRVAFTLANTGARAGAEVAQVYVGDPDCTVARPLRELRGFARVELQPGESQRVELVLGPRAFQYWHRGLGDWKLEGGVFEISVGASSRDLRLAGEVNLPDDGRRPPLTEYDSLASFLADPVAGPMVSGVLEGLLPAGGGNIDPALVEMMTQASLHTLTMLPGTGIDRDAVRKIVEATGGQIR